MRHAAKHQFDYAIISMPRVLDKALRFASELNLGPTQALSGIRRWLSLCQTDESAIKPLEWRAEGIGPHTCSCILLGPALCQILVLTVFEIACESWFIRVLPPAPAMRCQASLADQSVRVPKKICVKIDPIDASRRVSESRKGVRVGDFAR